MTGNPLATTAQRMIEDRALALLKRPELERARTIARLLWNNATAWPSRDQADRFDNMIDEYMFHHAMRAANGDANDPHATRFMAPPHRWFGRDVPGSRWGGDSPDFIYRTIPIAHGGRYEIHGRKTGEEAPTVNYSLMCDSTASPVTQTLLDSLDMQFESDGSFVITLDDKPADGRPNHMQTQPGADFIMVRDAFGDWLNQGPNALEVTRLNPDADPKSEEEMARHCAKIAMDGVYYTFYITHSGYGQAPNQLRQPMSAGAFGGMPTQWGTKGNVWLEEDEALLVRANDAGAGFRNLVLTDAFHISIEYWKRTSSLNMVQIAADKDGDYTFVISQRDPGIHNWLDTGGLRRMQFGQRWQAFPRGVEHDDPWMEGRLVKFDELERELPDGVIRIDEAGRKAQIAARMAGYARRFEEI
ncbi:MAG: hypothetical protein P8J20_07900 [Novosphingobium sp.]|nr:hypothetical protein [Novosphingobium sp.]